MIVCPNGHANPDGTTTCQVCDAYIDTTTAPEPPPPVPPILTLDPPTVQVVSGLEAVAQLQVENAGPDADDVVLDVIGAPAGWVAVEPSILSVAAGATGTATVTITLPADAPAGVTTSRLRATPSVGTPAEIELVIDVAPAPAEVAITARLEPLTSKGSTYGDHTVTVDNVGSAPASAALQGVDPSDGVTFGFDPVVLAVPPGASAAARVRVSPRQPVLVGLSRTFPFQVVIAPEGGLPVTADGRLVQRPRVPLWLLGVVALLVVIVAIIRPWEDRVDGGDIGDAVPSIVHSQGTTTLHGTFRFDVDAGLEAPDGADVWWEQVDNVERYLVPLEGALLAHMGTPIFDAITVVDLQTQPWATDRINGSANPLNQLTPGSVIAVWTDAGRYSKVRVDSYGYDLQITWVTYEDPATIGTP